MRTASLNGTAAKLAILLVTLFALFAPRLAFAVPEAHIMRIDPRVSQSEGAPVLTSVIELVQNKPLNTVIGTCSTMGGNAELDCIADKLEQPRALWDPIEFPESSTFFTILYDRTDVPAKFIEKKRWSAAKGEPGVGTAWLILVDAGGTMGPRFEEARATAKAFIEGMRENDIANVMFFNDRSIVSSSGWVADKAKATEHLNSVPKAFSISGRTRPLGQIVQQGATDGFRELGNVGQNVKVPLHQAMVVLSSGASGTDASSVGPAAKFLSQFMTKGRFPEDNTVQPKMPVPVISIWFPSSQLEELFENARQFMESLPNTEIGGLFFIVREGGAARGARIVNAIRARFDAMWIVKWQVSCVEPTVTQTFKLFFKNTDLPINGDASYANVPVGIDPQAWPLDIDREATERAAKENPIYPGGTVKIYGNFCWGGKKERAELYMVPKNQEVPETLEGGTLEDAKNAQKTLIEAGMRGNAISSSDSFVEFEVPDKPKFLAGKADKMTARLIVFDNGSKRTSAVTRDQILTLRAIEKPLPYLLVGGIAFGGVVLILLLVSIFRGGGKRRGSAPAAAPPPRPGGGGGPPAPMPMAAPAPPPPPMPATPAPQFAQRATLSGSAGIFTVLPWMEMKAGRDGALCQILLNEPRVSGTHATMKIDNGQLWARDDNSNNGTQVNGQRLPPGVWSPVPHGAILKFGPVEFSVTLE
ncbi:MAG: FHA domain-containing protein [Polyangiaceae bacterium]|nr:FHA domain-containing protein [Polyangiaceae bacterium]